MTRVVNVDMTVEQTKAICTQRNHGISTIEALLSGGTRVVLDSADGAAAMRRVFGSKLIKGPVKRSLEHRAF